MKTSVVNGRVQGRTIQVRMQYFTSLNISMTLEITRHVLYILKLEKSFIKKGSVRILYHRFCFTKV